MQRIILISSVIALFALNANANCEQGSQTLFSCTTSKGKQIEVCDAEKTINYSFGKALAKPEIAVKIPRDQVSSYQWNGMGSMMSYAVDIPNKNAIYNVFWGVDRTSEAHGVQAGVNVLINKKLVTTVHCVDKNIINNMEGVNLKPTEQ